VNGTMRPRTLNKNKTRFFITDSSKVVHAQFVCSTGLHRWQNPRQRGQ
jgi:hypothetical protein